MTRSTGGRGGRGGRDPGPDDPRGRQPDRRQQRRPRSGDRPERSARPKPARMPGGSRRTREQRAAPPAPPTPPTPEKGVQLRAPDGPLRARVDPLDGLSAPRRDDRTARGLPPRGRIGQFFADMGWRGYAVPILIVVTILVFIDVARGGPAPQDTGSRVNQDADDTIPGQKPTGGTETTPPQDGGSSDARALPAGGDFASEGSGEYDIVPGTSEILGGGDGPIQRFTVEIEGGIDVDTQKFADDVQTILADERGWAHGGAESFQRVDAGDVDFRISLTTPATIRSDDFCGFEIHAETSCYNAGLHRVLINVARWVRGAVSYDGNLNGYRQYAITHEVGHALGHDHQSCPKDGALAPPMLQQTLGLTTDGKTCKPNPWPFPDGDTEVTGPASDEVPT